MKDAKTIQRWSLGAIARFKIRLMRRRKMQAITKLGTPEFKDGRLHEDKTRPMLTTEEFSRMEQGSAKYIWDDYSTKIEDGKLYRG